MATVMNTPDFFSSAHEKRFLEEQLKEYIKVKDGDSTWKEFNEWRVSKGYDSVNTDSLRRSFQQLGVYTDAGLVGALTPSTPSTQYTTETSTNYDTGETTSKKTIKLSNTQLTDPNSLLRAHGFDPTKFEIKTVTNTEINRSTDRLDTGVTVETHTINSRLVVKPKTSLSSSDIADLLNDYTPHYISPANNFDSDEILVVPMYDLHFGRRTYKGHDGEAYDINEEKENILNHYRKYLDRFANREFDEVYLVMGQDFLNSCFTGFTSSQSHFQDNCTDVHTIARKGLELTLDLINMFKIISNSVKIIGNYGNHAAFEDYMTLMAVHAYYHLDDSVSVDYSPEQRKYITYYNNLIGFSHGDKEGKRINSIMSVEQREAWGQTTNHIWITGHIHHFSATEENGVTVYHVPSIVKSDKWTNQLAYASERKSMAFIFDKDELIETHTFKEK